MENKSMSHRFVLLCVLLLSGTSTAMASDLCHDPNLKIAVPKILDCKAEPILFRENGEVHDAQLAIVITNEIHDHDLVFQEAAYFLKPEKKGDELIALGNFPPAKTMSEVQVYKQLGYDIFSVAGAAKFDPDSFYDRLIERHADEYCMVYRMKQPFTGESLDCGDGKLVGKIGYSPGTITVSQAGKLVCDFMAIEIESECGNSAVKIGPNVMMRNADGKLFYRVTVRYPLQKMEGNTKVGNIEYGMRVYRIYADDGEVQIVEKTAQ